MAAVAVLALAPLSAAASAAAPSLPVAAPSPPPPNVKVVIAAPTPVAIAPDAVVVVVDRSKPPRMGHTHLPRLSLADGVLASMVLQFLNADELLTSASAVCKSWSRASARCEIWRSAVFDTPWRVHLSAVVTQYLRTHPEWATDAGRGLSLPPLLDVDPARIDDEPEEEWLSPSRPHPHPQLHKPWPRLPSPAARIFAYNHWHNTLLEWRAEQHLPFQIRGAADDGRVAVRQLEEVHSSSGGPMIPRGYGYAAALHSPRLLWSHPHLKARQQAIAARTAHWLWRYVPFAVSDNYLPLLPLSAPTDSISPSLPHPMQAAVDAQNAQDRNEREQEDKAVDAGVGVHAIRRAPRRKALCPDPVTQPAYTMVHQPLSGTYASAHPCGVAHAHLWGLAHRDAPHLRRDALCVYLPPPYVRGSPPPPSSHAAAAAAAAAVDGPVPAAPVVVAAAKTSTVPAGGPQLLPADAKDGDDADADDVVRDDADENDVHRRRLPWDGDAMCPLDERDLRVAERHAQRQRTRQHKQALQRAAARAARLLANAGGGGGGGADAAAGVPAASAAVADPTTSSTSVTTGASAGAAAAAAAAASAAAAAAAAAATTPSRNRNTDTAAPNSDDPDAWMYRVGVHSGYAGNARYRAATAQEVAHAYAHIDPAECKKLYVNLRRQLDGLIRDDYRAQSTYEARARIHHTMRRLTAAYQVEVSRLLFVLCWLSLLFSVLLPLRVDDPSRFTGEHDVDDDSSRSRFHSWAAVGAPLWIMSIRLLVFVCRTFVVCGRRSNGCCTSAGSERHALDEQHAALLYDQTSHYYSGGGPPLLPAEIEALGVQRACNLRVIRFLKALVLTTLGWALAVSPWVYAAVPLNGSRVATAQLMLWPLTGAWSCVVVAWCGMRALLAWSVAHGRTRRWLTVADGDDPRLPDALVWVHVQLLLITLKVTQVGALASASWLWILVPLGIPLCLTLVFTIAVLMIGPCLSSSWEFEQHARLYAVSLIVLMFCTLSGVGLALIADGTSSMPCSVTALPLQLLLFALCVYVTRHVKLCGPATAAEAAAAAAAK